MTEQTQNQEAPRKVECSAAKDPAVRLFILAAMLIGWGIFCFVDHYILGKYQYPDPYKLNAYLGYLHNHYGPYFFIPPGLVFLALGILFLRRRLIADDEGIGYVGRTKIPWNAVRSLDASKLADKGVLRLHYDAGGRERTMKLCSWKLRNFRPLVLLLEGKVATGSQ